MNNLHIGWAPKFKDEWLKDDAGCVPIFKREHADMLVGWIAEQGRRSTATEVMFYDAVLILREGDVALDKTTFVALKTALETSPMLPEVCRALADMMGTLPNDEIIVIRKGKTSRIFKEYGVGKTIPRLFEPPPDSSAHLN